MFVPAPGSGIPGAPANWYVQEKKTLEWFAFSVGTLQTCKVKISGCFIAFYIFLYRHKLHGAGMRSDAILNVSNSCLVNLLHKVVSR